MQTFVFDGVEVKKTGRSATRDVKKTNGDLLLSKELVEITPVDENTDWKKWVDPKLLFVVQ